MSAYEQPPLKVTSHPTTTTTATARSSGSLDDDGAPRPRPPPPERPTLHTSDSSTGHSRTFPFHRASNSGPSSGNPAAAAVSPSMSPRPQLASTSRPSYISLPPRTMYDGRPSPPLDVASPSGRASVSSAESAGSRIAPDLGGSSARYFPMRSVMYPSSGKTPSSSTKSRGSAGATSSGRSQQSRSLPPGSAEAVLAEEGFPDETELGANETMSRDGLQHGAEDLGLVPRPHHEHEQRGAGTSAGSAERPSGPRRRSSRTENGGGGSQQTVGTPSSHTSSDLKPASLDPFLSEPTTHAKIGDPDSDDDEYDHEDDSGEPSSKVQEQDFGDPTSTRRTKSPEPRSAPLSTTLTGDSSGSDRPILMTSRFEHTVTADGQHLVITGREGALERCEDEPIHAPGAVQAFGVLIAFDYDDSERMTIQQVSENSGFILGLPPRTLFKVKCLTDVLSEDEGDALRDAIDALDERDEDPSNDEQGPYTFTLSGRGNPGTAQDDAQSRARLEWTCHAAIHRPSPERQPKRLVLELELVDDQVNPLTTESSEPVATEDRGGMADVDGEKPNNGINPSQDDLVESTVSIARPLRMLARGKSTRLRRRKVRRGMDDLDVVGLLSQINDQLSKTDELETFLKITAGVFKELTEFDRVMVYQFDEAWNGRVVAEQVDWTRTKDLFRGLNFPASDIPPQARALYRLNKVRVLYDRDQPTARLCCRSMDEVDVPLDMTHCHLRAMSPIHIKYLGNMGVRSSMSISITAFGDLWGLIALHTYGRYGHRVSFPVRQLCKLLGQSISRNIERISYASRLQARKLINTAASDQNPGGYILAKADDLLDLFHADFGMLSIGDEAKILGQVNNSQELLAVLEYLRAARFTGLKSTQDINLDFPDIDYPNGFKLIAGLLCVPLSAEGKDFIFFCRSPQEQEVRWAGNPYTNKTINDYQPLEPRKSFAQWTEVVKGKGRAWTDEEKETASVLCLVYGKFIAVWREKESALAASQLTNLLLANASHEVRTPLNAIINYLELALDGPIVGEVRDNLVRSHAASKSLIHVINDLLDLTRTEKGNELFLTDPFNLSETLEEAISMHRDEAARRGLSLELVETPTGTPPTLIGDRAKIRQIVANVVGNALKHTQEGGILVEWGEMTDQNLDDAFEEKKDSIRIGISVTDTGNGISERKLENLFRQFEQISTIGDKQRDEDIKTEQAVGLGLAVVARIVRNLDGQLQVESKEGKGSKFTFVFPFRLPPLDAETAPPTKGEVAAAGQRKKARQIEPAHAQSGLRRRTSKHSTDSADSRASKGSSGRSEIDSLINAMASSHMSPPAGRNHDQSSAGTRSTTSAQSGGSRRSFRSALSHVPSQGFSESNAGSSAAARARAESGPGRVNVQGSQVPLRASRVGAESSSGATMSPVSSPNLTTANHNTYSPFFQPSSSSSMPSPLGGERPPQLERAESLISDASGYTAYGMGATPQPASPSMGYSRRESLASEAASDRRTSISSTTSHSSQLSTTRRGSISGTKSPRHISQYRKASVAPAAEDSIEPMRVLVVEDEMVNRMIIQQRLKKDGHDVVVAEHGGAAVRKFEEDRTGFDIVLMDLQMPIMNGVEASRNIRRIERESPVDADKQRETSRRNVGIPILAVSASLPERERPTIVDAELDGWLLKPIDFKRLRRLMRGALEPEARDPEIYRPGQWERGGWLHSFPPEGGPRNSSARRSSAGTAGSANGKAHSPDDA
ncbi:hypothetical protein JCM9279_000365 [Rhodotorula babjevae]